MCIYELTTASCADDKAIVKTDKPRLITLDDSPDWGNFVSEVAEKVGFSACAVSSHGCYARIAKTEPPDVLVLDLFMPDRDGIEMIMDIEASDDRPFILLISGQSKSFLDSAVRLGRGKGLEIIGALAKPFRLPDLKAMLQKAADLVEQKKKLGNKIRTMRSTQQTTAKPCDMVIDHDHIAKHDLQDSGGRVASERKQLIAVKQSFRQEAPRKTGNVASFPATENSLRRSIAEMIANTAKTEAVSSWQLALRIHTQTLVENRIAIREIANSLHLPGPGWSATESIDRISSIVSEILAAKRTNSASDAQMLASLRDLCSEKDRLKEKFAALLIAVNNALVLANDAAVSRSARTVGPR
jgi:CheY-like chemotaxis protein